MINEVEREFSRFAYIYANMHEMKHVQHDSREFLFIPKERKPFTLTLYMNYQDDGTEGWRIAAKNRDGSYSDISVGLTNNGGLGHAVNEDIMIALLRFAGATLL